MMASSEEEFEYTRITRTTRTIQNRRVSEKRVEGIPMLYGKDLKEYEHVNVDDLLAKLTPEEIEALTGDVDPDDSLLPPSERCREQTKKAPTGPLNRKKLLEYLQKYASEQEDWPDQVPYQTGQKRGKVFRPKEPEKVRPEDEPAVMLDLDEDSAAALDGANESDLVDLAGILGLHSMLNQDQYHASLLNKGQRSGLDKFESIVKATQPKPVPFLPPNSTDPVLTARQVEENDPALDDLNWNNIKHVSRETFKHLFRGLATNTKLKALHLCNVGLTDGPAETLIESLKRNKTLRVLNVESNFLSGPMIRDLLEATLDQQVVVEFRASNQRPQLLGNRIEMEIAKLVELNRTLIRLGLHFTVPDVRNRIATHLQKNFDTIRLRRIGSIDAGRS